MPPLLETLVTELERTRELTTQVVNHLVGTYGLTRDSIGSFLVDDLPRLEDYELDLILSPLFTPTLRDQAVFAELLGQDSVPANAWPALIQQLVARPTRGRFVTSDGQTHLTPLRDVTIERFVQRLRLDATVPEPLFNLINQLAPGMDCRVLKAVARRAIWKNDTRREILVRYLTAATGAKSDHLEDVVELLRLVETYQPADLSELLAQIPHWQRVLRQEINDAASPKPFFNERVQELHGGGRDQRRQDSPCISAKENERAFLARLQAALAA